MDNRRFYYLAEGECEEKLLKALKVKPVLIHPGKVERFNVIQRELKPNKLMNFQPGSSVVLVFDTDREETAILKKNIELLNSLNFNVEVVTIAQVLNYEDEMERCTDVGKAREFTKSKNISEFKSAVNRMKEVEFRMALKRHNLDITKLWSKRPPKAFSFVKQQADRVKE